MEFSMVAEYADGTGYDLHGTLEEGERLTVGGIVRIELMDDTVIEREILDLRKPRDHRWFHVDELVGPAPFEIDVADHGDCEVKTPNAIAVREWIEKEKKMVCLTPFEELRLGDASIHDWVEEGYEVPDKVLAYLKTTEPYMMSPGIYEHPFKPGERLLGPYCYTDGHYFWDRDTWKYVTKYHVKLPQGFVDYVMSGAGDEFAREHIPWARSWFQHIEDSYDDTPHGNYLPEDAGNVDIEDF
ncbi:MAG: hypothetical protein U0N69_06335 [Senegalimassilia anaerobia]